MQLHTEIMKMPPPSPTPDRYRQWEVLLKQCLRSKVTLKVETTV